MDNTPAPVVPTPTPTTGAPGGLQRPFPEVLPAASAAD